MISSYSGLKAHDSHRQSILAYIDRRTAELKVSGREYLELIKKDDSEFSRLIDAAAINETYFFREEIHFDFLLNWLFRKDRSEKIKIWSAACSSGQEPLSILALCKTAGADCEIFASDIDSASLAVFRKGSYPLSSVRRDGFKYQALLSDIARKTEDSYEVSPEIISAIHIFRCNLMNENEMIFQEGSLDIIFIRNVFLYFSMELRSRILSKLARFLKDDGLIFVGINEVASITAPASSSLVKEHAGNVYYFRKRDCRKNSRHSEEQESRKEDEAPAGEKAGNERIQKSLMAENLLEEYRKKTEKGRNQSPDNEGPEDFCRKFFPYADRELFDRAREMLDNAPTSVKNTEYEFYLRGVLFQREENYEEARRLYIKAGVVNPEFWPALFQLGIIGTKNGEQRDAELYFSQCMKVLEKNEKDEKICYNFIVESFSSDYFLELCRRYLQH